MNCHESSYIIIIVMNFNDFLGIIMNFNELSRILVIAVDIGDWKYLAI